MRQILVKIMARFSGEILVFCVHAWSRAKILLHRNAIKLICTTALLKGPTLLINSAIGSVEIGENLKFLKWLLFLYCLRG